MDELIFGQGWLFRLPLFCLLVHPSADCARRRMMMMVICSDRNLIFFLFFSRICVLQAKMEVEDLFVDLADGVKLLKLLEIISGEKLGKPNNGRMRVHKIENLNKSLAFLHTKVSKNFRLMHTESSIRQATSWISAGSEGAGNKNPAINCCPNSMSREDCDIPICHGQII
jgi:Calponin homology (CH) domain